MEIASLEAATAFKGKQLPWSETLIIPIGDIQIQENRKLVDLEGLKSVIDYGVKHNAFFIGMGDFVDMESPSSRSALKFSGVYDSVVDAIDAKAQELEDELKKYLSLQLENGSDWYKVIIITNTKMELQVILVSQTI